MLRLRRVIPTVLSVDLSPSGNVLATGSGDWLTRICAFIPLERCLRVIADAVPFTPGRYSDSPGSGSVEALPGLLSSVHI